MDAPDYKKIFQQCGDCYLVLLPDAPVFTIVAVSEAYLTTTHTLRERIVGIGIFEVFPNNPDDAKADGVKNLSASLHKVLENRSIDFMPIQKYDISVTGDVANEFEVRFWIPDNSPVFDENGNIEYIIHHVTDATSHENLIHQFGGEDIYDDNNKNLSQLERLNAIMVSRELRMIELKKELAAYRQASKA